VAVRLRIVGEDGYGSDHEDAQDGEHARGEHHRDEDGEAAVQPPGALAGSILAGTVTAREQVDERREHVLDGEG